MDEGMLEVMIEWPTNTPDSVEVRGTFSDNEADWWRRSYLLKRTTKGGFSRTIWLKPGRYEFKFVINGVEWCLGDGVYPSVDDGHGNTNNILVVETKRLRVEQGSTTSTVQEANGDGKGSLCNGINKKPITDSAHAKYNSYSKGSTRHNSEPIDFESLSSKSSQNREHSYLNIISERTELVGSGSSSASTQNNEGYGGTPDIPIADDRHECLPYTQQSTLTNGTQRHPRLQRSILIVLLIAAVGGLVVLGLSFANFDE